MTDLTRLSPEFHPRGMTCRAIIETPRGSRNKYTYDPENGLFTFGKVLPKGMSFPYDFGFIPGTQGEDGDPLDILVLMDAPAVCGLLLETRLIGVITAEQTEARKTVRNDRFIGVADLSFDYEGLEELKDLGRQRIEQLCEFFASYNKQAGKKFAVTGVHGQKKAAQLLKNGIVAR